MNNDKSVDFLPESERKEAKDALAKQSGPQQPSEIKLVMPEIAQGKKGDVQKKESWWQKRKRIKKEKIEEKKRKKGETGTAQAVVRKEREINESKKTEAELFSDVINHEPEKSWWESKKKSAEEKRPGPIKAQEKPTVAQPLIKEKNVAVMPKPEKKEISMPKKEDASKMHGVSGAMGELGPRVNLVPEEAMASAEGQPIVLAASILILVLAFWVFLGGYSISRVRKAQAQIDQYNAELTKVNTIISNYEPGKEVAQKLQKQFSAVEQLMEGHIYWTPIMQSLEETTIPDVYYDSITSKSEGEITLSAIAKNFEAAARQIRAFEKSPQYFKSVSVSTAHVQNQPGAKLPVPVVVFDINLQLVDNALFIEKPESTQ